MGFDLNVLVFCPTARVEPETVRAIFEQDYRGAYDLLFSRDNPYGHEDLDDDYNNILYNYRKMRRVLLAENYDAVWVIESDVLPPRDALRKLLAVEGDTAGGLYALRHGMPVPNVFPPGEDAGPNRWMTWEAVGERWGQVIETAGTCLGCVVIWRRVLEDIDFRHAHAAAPDVGLMQDVRAAGWRQMGDLSVVCGHKRPDGMVLWPTANGVEYERTAPSFWEVR